MLSAATHHYFQLAQGHGLLGQPSADAQEGQTDSGYYFRIQLLVEHEQIQQLAFFCPRCVAAIACGGYLQEHLPGLSLRDAHLLKVDHLISALGGLPASKIVYAWLAWKALQNALSEVNDD